MKFKDNAEIVCSSDFWYDLTTGGYIDPDKILEPDDAKRVKEAVIVLNKFYNEATENGIIEEL